MIDNIFAFGSNFKFADTNFRSKITADFEQASHTLKNQNDLHFITLNTCNRSEIYGIGNVDAIKNHFWAQSSITQDQKNQFFAYTGEKAMNHIFRVVCGLNSQIVGDDEISGQFRKASIKAKQDNHLNGFLEKMINLCLQAAKEIKTNTALSDGTKSVAYATTKFIKDLTPPPHAQILVVGTGEIGTAVIKNIKEYLPHAHLHITNRTEPKAVALCQQTNATHLPFEALHQSLAQFDFVVCTATPKSGFMFDTQHFTNPAGVHFIDLCVPNSVNALLAALPNVAVTTVDDISKILIETFERRNSAIPEAELILQKHVKEFENWAKVYQNKDAIANWQKTFEEAAKRCPHLAAMNPERMEVFKNKSIGNLVDYIKHTTEPHPPTPDAVLQSYKNDQPEGKLCKSAEDCIINRLNCTECNDH